MREYLATARNGLEVTYNPLESHAATHFADSPGLLELTRTIIEATVLIEDSHYFETDFERQIGMSDLVEIDESDFVVWALRKNRDRYAKFAITRKSEPTSIVTVVANRLSPVEFDLHSAWVGPIVPPFPGDWKETPESRPFWANHALAWGNQEVQKESITTVSPWD